MRKDSLSSKQLFWLSFLPAIAYWLLEEYTTLEIALMGGMALALIECIIEKYFSGHLHTMTKLNVLLILGLGGVSYFAKDGVWFRLQPFFTGYVIGGFLLYKKIRNESLMIEMFSDWGKAPPLPPEVYKKMELHLAMFFMLFSSWMAYVAIKLTTKEWLFWKTGGFYGAFIVFLIADLFVMRMTVRKKD